jgi:glycerol-3-phosphate dehydrogenase subunit B
VTARPGGAIEADVLVVGGGMAGAVAALAARDAGARVALVRRAPGATALSSGAVSVAPDHGVLPGDPLSWRRGPLESARRVAALHPDHPYAAVGAGLERLGEALAFAARQLGEVLVPPLDRQRFVMTPYGTAVPCALVQRTMEAGDLLHARAPVVVVGFSGHLGFDARLVHDGLRRLAPLGAPAAALAEIDPFGGELATARPHDLARALEAPGAAEAAGDLLRAALPAGAGVALLPPVLGLTAASRVADRIASRAGLPVAETLSDVPSVPGVRLQDGIETRLAAAGVTLVEAALEPGGRPGRPARAAGREILAGAWVLATGRFVGGGVRRRGALEEPLVGAPIQAAEGRESGVHLAGRPPASLTLRDRRAAQPLLSAGVRIDASLRPVDERGRPVDPRLFAAGAVVGGHEQATDGTGLGVAILTGYLAGRAAAAGGTP